MKDLLSLLEALKYELYGKKSLLALPVKSLAYSSKDAQNGGAFFCIVGAHADGHTFAKEAYSGGARVFFCQRRLPLPCDSLQIIVKNTRKALASVSAAFFGHPEKKLTLIGVTGTKGKSTVCEMISHIFTLSGEKCATIGTLGIKIDGEIKETENSTPESYVIYKALSDMVERGVKYVAMEVSSQALCTHRVDGLHFTAAVFTNLSRDHVGTCEHPTFEHYKEAKKSLFSRSEIAFINSDDTFAEEFLEACRCPTVKYGASEPAHIMAKNALPVRRGGAFGISFSCITKTESQRVNLRLPGNFSALNALAAIGVCTHFGVTLSASANALESARVRGRFEAVPCARGDITCIIDYAHNAASLEKALATLRQYAPARLICIFGSVGGRSKARRRELAEVAARLADLCIVTSDNPDFECALSIAEEIASYIPREKCLISENRADAISLALELAQSGDFLLFAGKGHEEYQLVRGKKLPFSERELIKNHIFGKTELIPFP